MLIPLRSGVVRRLVAAACLSVAAMALSACSSDDEGKVVVGFYPQEFLATSIGGDQADVLSLAQPGAEPHDMELTAQQVGAIGTASLVIYQRGMQPAVDDAVDNEEPDHALDLATSVTLMDVDTEEVGGEHSHDEDDHGDDGHDHGTLDPHAWLDPMLLKSMAGAVKDQLVEIDPDHEDTYTANYETLAGQLDELDAEFTTGLAQCQRHEIVTTHTAFAYLAKAYGLEQVGILGVSEQEPSPQDLAEVEKYVDEHGVTTIFFESGVSDDYAATVAESTGTQTAVLNTLETAPQSGDYISAMKENLAALRTALGCT